MTEKTLNFHLDDNEENPVSLTLSKSARISLTDIAAATIGNLSEDPQWADNSTSATDVSLSVLRPWEDNSSSEKSEVITHDLGYLDKQPPTYLEHLKRKIDTVTDDDDLTGDATKRIKIEPLNTNNDAATSYSYPVQTIGASSITQDTFQNSLQQRNNKHFSQKEHVQRQRLDTTFQSFVPIFPSHQTLPYINTLKSLQNENMENSLQNVTTQYFSTINSQDLLPATEATFSSQNANKSHFPLKNSSVLNDNTNIENESKNFMEQCTQPYCSVLTNQTGSINTTLPSLFKPQYSSDAQRCHTLPLQPRTLNWQTTTITSEQQVKEPSRPEIIKQIPQVPNFQQMQVTNTPGENKHMQSPWQHMSTLHPWDQPRPKHVMKQDPSTPVGKSQVTYSKFDSPGIDSRFTESLTNLLGSPPPDSPLSKNPFLGDLQALLTRECKREIVPQSLFGIQGSNKDNIETKNLNVFERERNLQERFTNLQSSHPEDIRQLSSMFRYQSALIETERFRTLHECQYPGSYKESVNHHYDNQLHKVMDRVERSVELLENSNKENKLTKGTKLRPHLSKEAVRLMEHWYQQNLNHPYPTNTAIEMLAQAGNIGVEQVKKWFANKRNRSSNTRSLTEIAMQKRKLGQMPGKC